MKKTIFMAIVAILITGLLVTPSMAKGKKFTEKEKGPSGQAGKSNIGHLYLYEKDPGDWTIVEGGMWGKMKYNLSGPTFDFVFNGHGLPRGQEFTLIYYPDPYPANGLICLGSGIATCDCVEPCECNDEGSVHIQGSYDIGDLPKEYDANSLESLPEDERGAKIWLVLTKDVACEGGMVDNAAVGGVMTGWTEGAYLFEGKLITFDDTDSVTE